MEFYAAEKKKELIPFATELHRHLTQHQNLEPQREPLTKISLLPLVAQSNGCASVTSPELDP